MLYPVSIALNIVSCVKRDIFLQLPSFMYIQDFINVLWFKIILSTSAGFKRMLYICLIFVYRCVPTVCGLSWTTRKPAVPGNEELSWVTSQQPQHSEYTCELSVDLVFFVHC